jgi:hypothetical protein
MIGARTRWRVEENIRFIKQSYGLEDIRLLIYELLRIMAALVMAAACLACVSPDARPSCAFWFTTSIG